MFCEFVVLQSKSTASYDFIFLSDQTNKIKDIVSNYFLRKRLNLKAKSNVI